MFFALEQRRPAIRRRIAAFHALYRRPLVSCQHRDARGVGLDQQKPRAVLADSVAPEIEGEYRLEARGNGLVAYRATFPIRGTYSQIREFVGTTLKDMSTASVDTLRFERKKAGDTQLEAQVRFTIHFRPDGEEAPRAQGEPEEAR